MQSVHLHEPDPKSPYRLIVEGDDDMHSIIHLLSERGYNWKDASIIRPFIHKAGGIDPLLEQIPAAIKTYERLGIVIDANASLVNRWNEIISKFREQQIQVPENPEKAGTIFSDNSSKKMFGIWLMPDNTSLGTLEHFLEKLIPSNDKIWPHAQTSTQQAQKLGCRLKTKDFQKGAIHCWLAWQDEPGRPFGTAITAHILNPTSPNANEFVDWFNRLFQ